jgi:hypothetical protein
MIDFNLLARIAKLVALLGFLLPWVVVSCSNNEIAQATGVQLMTGHIEPSEAMKQMGGADMSGGRHDPDPNIYVIAAFAVIAVGLLLGLVTRARAAAAIMLCASLAGIGLSYYSIQDMRAGLTRSMSDSHAGRRGSEDVPFMSGAQQDDMTRAMAGAIKVEQKEGFWVTLGALAVAALMSLFMLSYRRQGPPPRSG